TLIDNDNGNAQHAVLNFPAGLSGDVVFANVTLEAIGEGGDTSPLDLEVVSLTDGVDEIAHEVDNGTFTVLNTIVSIEDVALGAGETTTVPIMIENLDGGMGANIILSFDPDVVQVLDITGGDFNLPLYTLIDNDNGNAQHAVLNFPAGLSGDVVFANVTLEAIGEGGDTSPLDLEVVSLTDGVDEIAHEVDNGTFMVGEVETQKVVINEFVSNPSSGNEWIELYNLIDSDVLLDGWTIEDNTASPASLDGKNNPCKRISAP
ncbi:MAG: lamin tail domain-containing protein, partial [Candidatus Syntropharchaeales archaeon]